MAFQPRSQSRPQLGRAPTNNSPRTHSPIEQGEPKVSLKELPLKSNTGLIAGVGVVLVAIMTVLLYYGL